MWIAFAFVSAALLGLYDLAKKMALARHSVLQVLFVTTLCSSLIFLPFILISAWQPHLLEGNLLYVPEATWQLHLRIALKSVIVLLAWYFGYLGMQHLPLTMVGPINATRPVMVLLGAILIFGERLNLLQSLGVLLTLFSIILLSISGRREGINFVRNRWIAYTFLAAILGATSGLYDKYLFREIDSPMLVQSWYSIYQVLMMAPIVYAVGLRRGEHFSLPKSWVVLLVPILLSLADMAYFYALSQEESLISVVSMVRRGSVLVSFMCGAFILKERNLRAKVLDLLFILLGMLLLYLGTAYK